MYSNTAWMTNNLIINIHKSRSEVDKNVDNEHDIHYVINDDQGVGVDIDGTRIIPGLRVLITFLLLLVPGQNKRGHIWRHNRRINDKKQNQPVPECLERRIVKNCPGVDFRSLELVLWEDISTQGHNLSDFLCFSRMNKTLRADEC